MARTKLFPFQDLTGLIKALKNPSAQVLADKLKCTKATIYNRLREANLTIKNPKYTRDQGDAMLRLYRGTVTVKDIADRLEKPRAYVRRMMLKAISYHDPRTRARDLNEYKVLYWLEHNYADKASTGQRIVPSSLADIAQELAVSTQCVERAIERWSNRD